ncbi:MAG: single-stranded-DNA-specific exonuclease RecJ [Candidatus Aminicenantaceae bacterium]
MNTSLWIVSPPKDEANKLAQELDLPVEIAQIIANRGISNPESAYKFLFGTLDDLYNPHTMRDMKVAIARIKQALSRDEKIIIFSDYDVDGILSVVMLTKALETLGGNVEYFIPNRLKEGYGLKDKYFDFVLNKKASLIISADCGIKATGFVQKAKEKGIDVIITDHHLPGEKLPEALAILNPALPDSGYPDKNLASVGVVFKFIQALFEHETYSSSIPHYLKLVAIGTIADIAELRGENRIFVKYGLKGLENVSNIGLKSLMDTCGLRGKNISVADIGYRIGPRINAAGRLGNADLAVQLFFSKSLPESLELVNHLDILNTKRQKIEEKILAQAMEKIKVRSLDKRYKLLILGCNEWHRGVIGIVSSKLKDIFYRPVILFAYENGRAYGSGRSITELHLINCLNGCKDFFLSYGGHMQAIGCVLPREKMNSFKKAINSLANEMLAKEELRRKIRIDAKIDFNSINFDFLEKYFLLFPFGRGNPKPVFLTERAEVVSIPHKIQNKHTKLLVRQKDRTFEAIGWDKPELAQSIKKYAIVDLVYSLQFSEFLGEEKISLSVEEVKT